MDWGGLYISFSGLLTAFLVRELGMAFRGVYLTVYIIFGIQFAFRLGRLSREFGYDNVLITRGVLAVIIFFFLFDVVYSKFRIKKNG